MRTSVDLPDELFRRTKTAAAIRGRKFKDLVEEGLLRVLESPEESYRKSPPKLTLLDLMGDACGIVSSGICDLASNPKHLKEFGRD